MENWKKSRGRISPMVLGKWGSPPVHSHSTAGDAEYVLRMPAAVFDCRWLATCATTKHSSTATTARSQPIRVRRILRGLLPRFCVVLRVVAEARMT
jgi:hypothetical protein